MAPLDHLPHEEGVVVGGVEIAAAPEHQGLVDGVLETVVALLGYTVFMTLAAIDAGGPKAVVVQQGGVVVVERSPKDRVKRHTFVCTIQLPGPRNRKTGSASYPRSEDFDNKVSLPPNRRKRTTRNSNATTTPANGNATAVKPSSKRGRHVTPENAKRAGQISFF